MGLWEVVLLTKRGATQGDKVFWAHWGPGEAGEPQLTSPRGLFGWPTSAPWPCCVSSPFPGRGAQMELRICLMVLPSCSLPFS